jgi:hypothetical protein
VLKNKEKSSPSSEDDPSISTKEAVEMIQVREDGTSHPDKFLSTSNTHQNGWDQRQKANKGEAKRLANEGQHHAEKAQARREAKEEDAGEEELETEGNPTLALKGSLGKEAKSNIVSDGRKINSQFEAASTDLDHPLVSDLEAEHGSDAEELRREFKRREFKNLPTNSCWRRSAELEMSLRNSLA